MDLSLRTLRPLLRAACLTALLCLPAGLEAGSPVSATPASAPTAPLGLDDGAGPSPRALVVDGEYDAVRVPAHPDLQPEGAITLEAWVSREPALGCGSLIGTGRSQGYWLGICGGRLRFSPGGGAAVDGGAILPEQLWTHVAVSYAGGEVRFYIDGVLDRQIGQPARPITAGPEALVIGADAELGAAYAGRIDQVRLWRVVRSQAQVEADRMRQLGVTPGLVAEWPMDSDARDRVGMHDGEAVNGGTFTFDGVLPRALDLPLSEAEVTVDARCDPGEYGTAERMALDGQDRPKAYVQASAEELYVCLEDLPEANLTNALAVVYVDRDASGEAQTQPGDYRFSIRVRGTTEAEEANGQGGWRDLDLLPGEWQAESLTRDEHWQAEFRLPRRLIGAREDPGDEVQIGLALAYEQGRTAGDGIFWPVDARATSAGSWALSTLAEVPGIAPEIRFEGRVLRWDDEGQTEGIAGSDLQLLGAYEDALVLLDTDRSDAAGGYALSYRARGRMPQSFLLRQANAPGTHSLRAEAGAEARIVGPDLIAYAVDEDLPTPRTDYADSRFVDREGPPPPEAGDRHYLIVYAPPVEEEDLWAIVEAKRAQGFRVEPISTEQLQREGSGRDLAERIHNWLEARWEAADEAPVYALLVGRGDKIPFRDVGWLDNDHRRPGSPGYFPAWPTDWYYADLDSDWDADGDGFHGEFMGCRPGAQYADAEAEEGLADCPESGSLTREGPFGALRTADDDFEAEIAVGRIALNEPGEVRRALAASVAAEIAGGPSRRRALVMGGFWHFAGSSYSEDLGGLVGGGAPQADPWVRAPWTGEKPFGLDSAEAFETGLLPRLSPFLGASRRLYEANVPDGLSFLSPSARQPDAPLTAAAVAQAWTQGYGLVQAAGNAAPEGLVTGHWEHDWNGNFAIDNPARPGDCEGEATGDGRLGPPCYEILAETVLDASLPAPEGPAPLVVANAGRSAEVAWTWSGVNEGGNVIDLRYGPAALAGALPARGRASAWVGALTAIRPGALDAFQAGFSERLMSGGTDLGGAFWAANAELARGAPYDLRSYAVTLFGDPAMGWWQGPAETRAIWPADGRDAAASSASPLAGPASPERVWSFGQQGPQSPPVVDADGSLILGAASGRALRLDSAGDLLSVDGPGGGAARFAPALASGGLYLAVGDRLSRLDEDLLPTALVGLPGQAVGAPRIAPDGAVWLPSDRGMLRVDGQVAQRMGDSGLPSGSVVFRSDGEAVWSTRDGLVYALNLERGETRARRIADLGTGLTPPVLGPDDRVYLGTADGRLVHLPVDEPMGQVGLGGRILTRPVVDSDGTVYVGNDRGSLAAFAEGRGSPLWRRELGQALRAPASLDGRQLYLGLGSQLVALDLATGLTLWSEDLGGPVDERSVPVIGPGRSLYLLRADDQLVALRERGWLAPPTGLQVAVGADNTRLSWNDSSQGETGFAVEICSREGDCRSLDRTPAGQRMLLVRELDLDPGEPFYARVTALGSRGVIASGYGNSALMAAPATPPLPPRALVAEAEGSDRIALRWDYPGDPGQLEGFAIERRDASGGGYRPLAIVGADARMHIDRELVATRAYDYRLRALGLAGGSDSVEAGAETWPRSLRAPSELRARARGPVVQLDWQDNARDETGYRVERRDPGSSSYRVVGQLSAGVTRFFDALYLADGNYHYRLRAVGEEADSQWRSIGVLVSTIQRENLLHLPWLTKNR